jgi:hypothetical protein
LRRQIHGRHFRGATSISRGKAVGCLQARAILGPLVCRAGPKMENQLPKPTTERGPSPKESTTPADHPREPSSPSHPPHHFTHQSFLALHQPSRFKLHSLLHSSHSVSYQSPSACCWDASLQSADVRPSSLPPMERTVLQERRR